MNTDYSSCNTEAHERCPLIKRVCPMCDGNDWRVHFVYSEPPPLETRFSMTARKPYWRELHRCRQCGHFLERFDCDQNDLYEREYVSAVYGDADGIKRTFDRINALPPEKSDNIGRVHLVDDYCRQYWSRLGLPVAADQLKLLDVGAGLGVFPFRMKSAGWNCVTIDMDRRLVDHHRSVIGLEAHVADVTTVAGLGQFDLVTFNKVLEHVEEPVAMLAGVARLLMPHGLIYVELPDGEVAATIGKEREEFLLGHRHVFSFASFSLMVQKAGFELRTCERLCEPSGKFTLRGFARSKASA